MDKEINCIKLTPSHLELIEQLTNKINRKKLLIVGGDRLGVNLANRSFKMLLHKDGRLINEYGPTEATIGCIFHEYSLKLINQYVKDDIPIGRPIDNTQIELLNNEIIITGTCLAKGYIGEDPLHYFSVINNQLSYKSGDFGFIKNNMIYYSGRKDQYVKINGYRIELSQINFILESLSEIETAITLALPLSDPKHLVSYIKASRELTSKEIRVLLLEQVPFYMIPRHFVLIDKFPLTDQGKIDKESLSKIKKYISDEKSNYDEISSDLEEIKKKLSSLWIKTLNLEDEDLDWDSNFYLEGGDSIQMLSMLNLVSTHIDNLDSRKYFEEQYASFYQKPTLYQLCTIYAESSFKAI